MCVHIRMYITTCKQAIYSNSKSNQNMSKNIENNWLYVDSCWCIFISLFYIQSISPVSFTHHMPPLRYHAIDSVRAQTHSQQMRTLFSANDISRLMKYVCVCFYMFRWSECLCVSVEPMPTVERAEFSKLTTRWLRFRHRPPIIDDTRVSLCYVFISLSLYCQSGHNCTRERLQKAAASSN